MTMPLFKPCQLGRLTLRNRIVMAPMTRSRADARDAPSDLQVAYYAQRASAGLIVAEGTYPHPDGKGYCRTPGIASRHQIDAWRRVTDAVHQANGLIVLQLMHVGRVASRDNKSPDSETVAPSAIRANGVIHVDGKGPMPMEMPRALERAEIPDVIDGFRLAAINAIAAGFDGVELHASSGYLPMQFLLTCANRRTDDYGGALLRRIRFTVESLEAITSAIGADRTGLRICPGNPYNDMHDDDPVTTYGALLEAVSPLELAYLHVSKSPDPKVDAFAIARRNFRGALIVNDGFDGRRAADLLAVGQADAVSFARHFIANPDLVARFRSNAPLAAFDRTSLYTPGAHGYTDYPPLEASGACISST
jgi:N-ethylmaleimide reductase